VYNTVTSLLLIQLIKIKIITNSTNKNLIIVLNFSNNCNNSVPLVGSGKLVQYEFYRIPNIRVIRKRGF
jgi:hypothetical protein